LGELLCATERDESERNQRRGPAETNNNTYVSVKPPASMRASSEITSYEIDESALQDDKHPEQ
jgi:hypothetical protein